MCAIEMKLLKIFRIYICVYMFLLSIMCMYVCIYIYIIVYIGMCVYKENIYIKKFYKKYMLLFIL